MWVSVVTFIVSMFLLHSLGLEHRRSRWSMGCVHEGVMPSDCSPERVDIDVNEDTAGPICDSASLKGNTVSPISFLNSLLFSHIKLGDEACVFLSPMNIGNSVIMQVEIGMGNFYLMHQTLPEFALACWFLLLLLPRGWWDSRKDTWHIFSHLR